MNYFFQIFSPLSVGHLTTDSRLSIDGVFRDDWCFEETLIDASHCVSVALKMEKLEEEVVFEERQSRFEIFENLSDILSDLKPFAYQENSNDWADFQAKYKTKNF